MKAEEMRRKEARAQQRLEEERKKQMVQNYHFNQYSSTPGDQAVDKFDSRQAPPRKQYANPEQEANHRPPTKAGQPKPKYVPQNDLYIPRQQVNAPNFMQQKQEREMIKKKIEEELGIHNTGGGVIVYNQPISQERKIKSRQSAPRQRNQE